MKSKLSQDFRNPVRKVLYYVYTYLTPNVEPKPQKTFWEATCEWREQYAIDELDLDPDEIWGDVRDRSPGREFSWDED